MLDSTNMSHGEAQSMMAGNNRSSDYNPAELLTIITATSPIASHPSIDIVLRGIESLCRYAGLAGCRHLIVCDGCGHEDPDSTKRYSLYKASLRLAASAGMFHTRAEICELPRRAGLPGVILAGAAQVQTPYVLVFEHDWQLVREIDTQGILRTLATSSRVQYIRLNREWTYEGGWDFILKPDVRRRPVPLLRTSAWSANPHFSKMSYYRSMVLPHLVERPEGGAKGFEEPLFTKLCREIRAIGFDRAHRRWGVFVYGRLGDPPVVGHLDGRESGAQRKRPDIGQL